jgi:hypothetical protein
LRKTELRSRKKENGIEGEMGEQKSRGHMPGTKKYWGQIEEQNRRGQMEERKSMGDKWRNRKVWDR